MKEAKVTVLTIEDNNIEKDYVVLDQIDYDKHDYLILFEDEKPTNLLVVDYYEENDESDVIIIDDDKLKAKIYELFFMKHPEFRK